MRIIPYQDFSLKFHKKNWQSKKPNVCQFELTFGCDLHCKHCYSDCYNKAKYLKRELNTAEVKFILDKVYRRGALWLCFTGGDPLTRKDFLELYAYAKNKGFIVTLFTNAYSMNKKIIDNLKDKPPFVIEITLNAVTQKLYEKISQVKGSYAKAMQGIELILKASLPFKIKTQVTQDNLGQLPKIKQFIKKLGLVFRPNILAHSRLNGDLTPAKLRISPQEALHLNGDKRLSLDDCDSVPSPQSPAPSRKLFLCAIAGGDGVHIDPYGNTFPCNCIREPKVSLLKETIADAREKVLNWVRIRQFNGNSKCQSCPIRNICHNCPGKALLETGNLEGVVGWFCGLAHLNR